MFNAVPTIGGGGGVFFFMNAFEALFPHFWKKKCPGTVFHIRRVDMPIISVGYEQLEKSQRNGYNMPLFHRALQLLVDLRGSFVLCSGQCFRSTRVSGGGCAGDCHGYLLDPRLHSSTYPPSSSWNIVCHTFRKWNSKGEPGVWKRNPYI